MRIISKMNRHARLLIGCGLFAVGLYLPGSAVAASKSKQVYHQACAFCHDAGAHAAPAIQDSKAWAPRLAKPRSALEKYAIQGHKGIPASAGFDRLSKSQVVDALDYLIDLVEEAQKKASSARSRSLSEIAKTKRHEPPGDHTIPNDQYGADVRLGQRIFTQTPAVARRYSGNGLACSNCHLDAGRRTHAAPLWAAYGMYPAYHAKNDRNITLEERIQQCFRFSLNGIAPALDTPEIHALVSYAHFLAKGAPVGVEMLGRGFPEIARTGFDPNPTRGGAVYKAKCANCHGDDGQGQKTAAGSYANPPLWGLDSYNKGAGFARHDLLAGFIKANMPLGQGGTLSNQEALDLAVFINLQIRPADPRKGLLTGWIE